MPCGLCADEEFLRILEKAKETKSLVVVEFYRTSWGNYKYIEQGFGKLGWSAGCCPPPLGCRGWKGERA